MDKYEEMARKYIEGVGGLFDLYRNEGAPFCEPHAIVGARWMLLCLVQPENKSDLDALVNQARKRMGLREGRA